MSTILAPIDFSPVSTAVGREALSLGAALRQRVTFLHVLSPVDRAPMDDVNLAEVLAAGELNARGRLHTFASGLGATTAELTVATGFVTEEILLHARIIKASHIALGRAYAFNVEGGTQPGRADQAGANDSLIHIDWMIGTPDTDVDGVYEDGRRESVMRSVAVWTTTRAAVRSTTMPVMTRSSVVRTTDMR